MLKEAFALIDPEAGDIANMANLSALIMQTFSFHWVGFYLAGRDQLLLGPFQGPVACTRIAHGKGVCGTAWASGEIQNISNVHEFPGHIACSPYSNAELVIPCKRKNEVWAVLDIDSTEFSAFDQLDINYLHKITELL
jgi:GAF domain-containing protein